MKTKFFPVFILIFIFHLITAIADEGPSKQELSGAEHYTLELEDAARRAQGKPFDPNRFGAEALKRVRALAEAYPDHPKSIELKERVRKVLILSKGSVFEITAEMLAYQQNEKQLSDKISQISKTEWETYLQKLKSQPTDFLEQAYPAPDPERVNPDDYIGKKVLISDFYYPQNEFTNSGKQYVAAGSKSFGYYFVELSNRNWIGVYEAVKRYKDTVSINVPDGWIVVGEITGFNALVPQAGEENTASQAFLGWVVTPLSIYVPEIVYAFVDNQTELGGSFSGEKDLSQLRDKFFTYKEIPQDSSPAKLVEIFATAIKEKNYDLYIECIDPAMRKGPNSSGRLKYFWTNSQERFAYLYVHVDPYETGKPYVLKGEKIEDDESFFLTTEDQKEVLERASDLVEAVEVKIRHYDNKGKQVLMPNTIILRRYKGGRWYIYSGFPL